MLTINFTISFILAIFNSLRNTDILHSNINSKLAGYSRFTVEIKEYCILLWRKIMKKSVKIIITILIFVFCLFFVVQAISNNSSSNNFRGLWVASVLNIDYPSKPSTDSEVLKNEAIKVLDNAKNMGINAVFLQVRPTSDALYKSNIFPWSKYLTATQGSMPNNDFDPLEFWVAEAHKRNIQLHAWINPYRITKNTAADKPFDFESLAPSNPAILHSDWVVQHSDGNLYYDPGIPEVRKLIIDGVDEIVKNYSVDGIVFDDYFYPGKDFNDKLTYEKYGTSYSNVNDWRRENVNLLIKDVAKSIKSGNSNVRFGISPFGIWANRSVNALGSDTNGLQSYYDHYADSRKWVKEGLIDYISPQLYWNIGSSAADYSKLLSWWQNTVHGTGVDLYISQAAYRYGSNNTDSAWYGVAELERQLKLNNNTPDISGSVFYNYSSLANNPAISAVLKATYEKTDDKNIETPVNISVPAENIKTNYTQYYLYGSSDPKKPLFLNGNQIDNRSAKGYFGILLPLEKGANIFTFSQKSSYSTTVIFRNSNSAALVKMSKAEIPLSSTFPQKLEYRESKEKITLTCKAPIGSKVTVKIGGKTFAMKPATTKTTGTGIYSTNYSYVYTLLTYNGTPRVIDLGKPIYTMTYKKIVKTCTAPAKIGVIMKNAPFHLKVTKNIINTYDKPTAEDGSNFEIYKDMVDNVTGMTGNYVRLSSRQWVEKSDVKTYYSKSLLSTYIKKAEYIMGDKWDQFKLTTSNSAVTTATFNGTTLTLNISTAVSTALPTLPENSLFSSIAAIKGANNAVYLLKLKNQQLIEGFYIERTASGMILNIKRPVIAIENNMPLSGIKIMLDPGHGGSSLGALGPLGLSYPEKNIVLNTSQKLKTELEKFGATVLMTRTTDKNVSLDERLTMSRNAKPDLFISLHANSMNEDVDISKVDGFSVFYQNQLAKPVADVIYNDITLVLNRNLKGVHQSNFYVNRGTWTPSILIESGFVPNPNEFEWLTDDNQQTVLVQEISKSILKYFVRP